MGTNFLAWWTANTQEAPVSFQATNLGESQGYRFSVDVSARPALLSADAADAVDRLKTAGTPVSFETYEVYRRQGDKVYRRMYAKTLTGTLVRRGAYPYVRLDFPLRTELPETPSSHQAKRIPPFGVYFADPLGRDMTRFVEAAVGALFLQVVDGSFELDPPWAEDGRKGKQGVRSCENCAFVYRIPVRDEPVWVEHPEEVLTTAGDGDELHADSNFLRYGPSSRRRVLSDFGVPSRTGGWQWPRYVCSLKLEELDAEVARCLNFDRHFPHETYEPIQARRARRILWEQEAISHAERCPHHHWELDRGGDLIQEMGRVGRMYTEPSLPIPVLVEEQEWAVAPPGPQPDERPGVRLGSLRPNWSRPGALHPVVRRAVLEGPVVHLPGWVFVTKRGVLAA